jgi:hypothetical protein
MTTHQAGPSEITMIFFIKMENKFNLMFLQKTNFSSACRIDLSCVKSTNSLVFSCSVAHQCMFKASLIIPQCIDKVLCCHSPLIFGNYCG